MHIAIYIYIYTYLPTPKACLEPMNIRQQGAGLQRQDARHKHMEGTILEEVDRKIMTYFWVWGGSSHEACKVK